MRSWYFSFLFFLFLTAKIAASDKKDTIANDLLELRGELLQAADRITQLKKDKANIDSAFKSLEEWALQQQREKIEIYEENERCRESLSQAEQRIVAEKTEHKKTADKYRSIKAVMGYLAGALLGLLYARIGATIVTPLISATGPWGAILSLLGPVGAFAAGYFMVQLYF
jgi:hypothetical protein